MTDPHTSMSLAAILVLTVVVMVLLVGWLAVVFLAAREPGAGGARPGGEDPARPAGRVPAGQPGGPHRSPVTTRRASRCRLAPGSPGERRAGFPAGPARLAC
jgi:hypothetical protein